MRASTLLFLTVLILLVSADDTSAFNTLQETGTEEVDGTDRGVNSERLLREDPSVVDKISGGVEERAPLTIFLKKRTSGATSWLKDKILATKLKLKALPVNLDNSVQKLMEKGIDPDRVFTLLQLHKASNRKIDGFTSGEYKLWEKLTDAWTEKYPNWVSKIPKNFFM